MIKLLNQPKKFIQIYSRLDSSLLWLKWLRNTNMQTSLGNWKYAPIDWNNINSHYEWVQSIGINF